MSLQSSERPLAPPATFKARQSTVIARVVVKKMSLTSSSTT